MERILLSPAYLTLGVAQRPGAYILCDSRNRAVYVGRADSNLLDRLRDHLPNREQNQRIVQARPTHAYISYAQNEWGAYQLERDWFNQYRSDIVNLIAPAIPYRPLMAAALGQPPRPQPMSHSAFAGLLARYSSGRNLLKLPVRPSPLLELLLGKYRNASSSGR